MENMENMDSNMGADIEREWEEENLQKVAKALAYMIHDLTDFGIHLGLSLEDIDEVEETKKRAYNAPQFYTLIKKMWNIAGSNQRELLLDACKHCGVGKQYFDLLHSDKGLKELAPKGFTYLNFVDVIELTQPHSVNRWLFLIANNFWKHLDLVIALSIYLEDESCFLLKYIKKFDLTSSISQAYCLGELYELLRRKSITYTCSSFWKRICLAFGSTHYSYCDSLKKLAIKYEFDHMFRFNSMGRDQ